MKLSRAFVYSSHAFSEAGRDSIEFCCVVIERMSVEGIDEMPKQNLQQQSFANPIEASQSALQEIRANPAVQCRKTDDPALQSRL